MDINNSAGICTHVFCPPASNGCKWYIIWQLFFTFLDESEFKMVICILLFTLCGKKGKIFIHTQLLYLYLLKVSE